MVDDQELKIALCETMKELYSERILTDIGGNLSFRSVEEEDVFWISPSGLKKNTVEPQHLVKMSFEGDILDEGSSGRGPSVEWPMHLRIYKEDEDFSFVIHSHAPLATAVSLLENPPKFPNLTAELTFLIPEVIIVPYKKSGSEELGEAVAENIWDSSVLILENHGVIAVSEDSIQEAAIKTRGLEEYLQLYLNAKKFGGDIRPFPGF